MSSNDIIIFHAHTGARVRVNRYYFLSLDELKRFCASQLNVPLQQLFLLSSFGLKLKSSSLEHADEIYVFDKSLFSIDDVHSIQRYVLSQYTEAFDNLIHPINSPLLDIDLDRLAASKSSRQLMGLLTTNLGWVAAIESDSNLFMKKATELSERVSVLFKSMRVANLYIENYCTEVKKSYDATLDFLMNLQKQTLSLKWEDNYAQLQQIKTSEGLSLSTLLNQSQLQSQASECISLNDHLNKNLVSQRTRISASNTTRTKVDEELAILENETSKILKSAEPEEWLRELKLLSDKVKSDTRHLLDQSKDSLDDFSIDIIVETFQLHKSQFVTSIYQLSISLYQLFSSYKELFTKMQISLSSFLQRLSQAQAEMVGLRESLKSVSEDIERLQELESHLAHTADLPLLYGLYIIEGVRRHEWLKSMKTQAAKNNESLGSLREKEVKTRSNWIKNYGDILKLLKKESGDFNSESLVSFDMNVHEGTQQQPVFTLEDAGDYIQQLQELKYAPETISVLAKAVNDIPVRLARLASSQEANPESKDLAIKGYKGRIKKLESLLHQEQFKNFQHWPSSTDRLSVASRYSINEKLAASTRPESMFKLPSSPTLSNSGELAKALEDKRTLTNDLKRYKNTVEMLNEELKSLRHQTSTKDFETQTLQNTIEKLKDDYNSQISRLQLEISEQEVAKAHLEGKLAKIEEEITEYASRSVMKEKQITTLKSEHKSALQRVEEKLASKDTEIAELKKTQDEASKSSEDVDSLKSELEELRAKLAERETQLQLSERAIAEKEIQIERNVVLLKKKDISMHDLTTTHASEVTRVQEKNLTLQSENSKLANNLETLKENYERLSSMKNDLLENMSNRENEFGKEKVLHQEENESLKMKLEEFEKVQSARLEEIASLSETKKLQANTIVQLVVIVNSLIIKSRDLSEILVIFYDLLCSTLKAMGLLAVRSEKSGEVSIIRVKGLKKATGDLGATVDLANGLKPGLEQDVFNASSWTELPDAKLLEMSTSSDRSAASESLDAIVEMLTETYNLTSFEEKYLTFVECVTNLNGLYLTSVSKRFKEVEQLAKKELKENRKLKDLASKKISVRNFEKNDLVLFLPTRSNGTENQWAAFNDMGDSKFLLKNTLAISSQKQWFIGKILELEEMDNKEFLITAEEIAMK